LAEVNNPSLHQQGTERGKETGGKTGVEKGSGVGRVDMRNIELWDYRYIATLLYQLAEQSIGMIQ